MEGPESRPGGSRSICVGTWRGGRWRRSAILQIQEFGSSMFDKSIRSVMQRRKVLKAAPETLVSKAAGLMAAKNVGAIMVIENDHLVGIFTERDVVFRVVARGLDAQA